MFEELVRLYLCIQIDGVKTTYYGAPAVLEIDHPP